MIKTERLVLRRARHSDLETFHDIMTRPEVMRYWSRPAHTEISETQGFVDYLVDHDWSTREEYVMELDGKCIGKCGCWCPVEFGFITHPDYWGKGFTYEASAAIIPRAFAKFADADAITADADPRNLASGALLRKLGFKLVRTGKADFLYGEDEWTDTDYYSLPRP